MPHVRESRVPSNDQDARIQARAQVNRYWLHFDIAEVYPAGWPQVVGATGRDLADCMDIIASRYGRERVPPLTASSPIPTCPTLSLKLCRSGFLSAFRFGEVSGTRRRISAGQSLRRPDRWLPTPARIGE
ncbi:hypothetical protein Cci01nite_60350 [Catellatospora citrea]|uniref:Uncharacterized protein n=1 Tax=Catellatospora citrea TaxID=53366 RepID=A0A8J3KD04_9ACTN|nr:hypothetical protein Cci01nite_60350 [Catellatospora citrea]